MGEMREIVADMLERVQVDLTGDELIHKLMAFDLPQWGDAAKRPSLSSAAEGLAKILKLNQRLVREFADCAKMLCKLQQAANMNSLKLPNRQAWALVLLPEWRCKFFPKQSFKHMTDLASMIVFYLGLKTNTTTLERNLGELCRQLAAHSGPGDEGGRTMAAVLEVALDGPKSARELFESSHSQSGQHQLAPSHFARSCAKMWVHCFGRRFQYKYSFKHQEGPAKPRAALKGSVRSSFANFQRKHGEAMSSLNKAGEKVQKRGLAVPSFIEGMALPLQPPAPSASLFEGTRWSTSTSSSSGDPSSSSSAKHKHPSSLFREHTARKRQRILLSTRRAACFVYCVAQEVLQEFFAHYVELN